jgi:Leucine-rich repeat (LRR) protein
MDQPPLPQEVRAWLDEVKWSNSLALDNFNLGSIPEEVFSWTHLAELFLTQNQITQVPSSIAKLNKLRYLDLSYNNIESIPLELCQMPSLTRLHITNCNLSSLPDHFSQFPGLKFLSLSGNSFKEIPEPVLKLKSCVFSCFVSCAAQLFLTPQVLLASSLESLYINYNKITTIPEDIHERLPNLTTRTYSQSLSRSFHLNRTLTPLFLPTQQSTFPSIALQRYLEQLQT